jgi:peptidoglycan hydrolase-like protein with peptidoglycan-binding domain
VLSNTTATTLPTTTAITTTITVKLPTTTPLQLNDTGPQVKLLQAALKQLGFYTGAVDGSFGPATQSAVQQFQSANGLSPDGVVGPQTLTTLKQQVQQQSSG